jgi:hypothetical protein
MKKIVLIALTLGLFGANSWAKSGCMSGSLASALKKSVGLGTTINAKSGGAIAVSGTAKKITVLAPNGVVYTGSMCAQPDVVIASLKGSDGSKNRVSIRRAGKSVFANGSMSGIVLKTEVE